MVEAGLRTRVGGIGQSFLVSNKFSEADPVLSQGVPCLTGALGMSSNGGGLELWVRGCTLSWGLVVRQGTSANCPVANLYTITSMDVVVDFVTGVWLEVMATMGAGAVEFTGAVGMVGTGWASTLTLYFLLLNTVFFSFVTCLGSWDLSNNGVGAWVGWSQLGLLWMGLGLGPGFRTKLSFLL